MMLRLNDVRCFLQILAVRTGRSSMLGTSSNMLIANVRTAALRKAIGEPELHTFEFVDGALSWTPDAGKLL